MAGDSLIEKALNIRAFYHKIIAGNLANVNTPNYKRKEIDFASEMKREIKRVEDIRVKEIAEVQEGVHSPDGNTVDLDEEMVKLTENTLMYNALIQILVKRFSLLRYLINEGRR